MARYEDELARKRMQVPKRFLTYQASTVLAFKHGNKVELPFLCLLFGYSSSNVCVPFQTEHEAQRKQNVELVRMQEESSLRKEQARRATEEQIQQQLRQTEKERAEIDRETIRVKAIAEAEGRAHETKLTEEHNRRMLLERMKGEREKWLAAINATFNHIEGIACYFLNFAYQPMPFQTSRVLLSKRI